MKTTVRGLPLMLLAILRKNLARIRRSRSSMLVILFGPIALMLIVGLAFNASGLSGIRLAAYADEYPGFADDILTNIEDNAKAFSITKQKTEEACKRGVEEGDFHLCMIFDAVNESVELHVDYSKMNLVWTLLEVMNTKLREEASSIGQEMSYELFDQLDQTHAALVENGAVIGTLGASLEEFQAQLGAITLSLEELDVEAPDGGFDGVLNTTDETRDELKSSHEHVATVLSAYEDRIDSAQAEIQEAQATVKEQKESREALHESVERSYDTMECASKNPKDLTAVLDDSDALQAALDSDPTPECSILLTMKRNLEGSIDDLERMEAELEAMDEEMEAARDEIGLFEEESDALFAQSYVQLDATEEAFGDAQGMLDEAKNKSAALGARKAALQEQLTAMKEAAGEGAETIGSLEESLGTVVASLAAAGTISPEKLITPFDVSVKPVTAKGLEELDFLYPVLFNLVIMFVAVLLGVTIVNKEKGSRAHFRNFITPAPDWLFIVGTFLTVVLLTLVQVIILLLLGTALFSVQVAPVIGGLLVVILLAISLFGLFGILIASVLSSEETSTLAGIIACVILFLFSSTLIPLESMAEFSKALVMANPFYLCVEMFRKQLIFGTGLLSSPALLLGVVIELFLLGAATLGAWALIRKRF